MYQTLAMAIVAMLTQILPTLGAGSGMVESIITTLIQLIPVVVKEAQDLVAPVQNIIAALRTKAVTPAQITAMQQLDAVADAAFDAAAGTA